MKEAVQVLPCGDLARQTALCQPSVALGIAIRIRSVRPCILPLLAIAAPTLQRADRTSSYDDSCFNHRCQISIIDARRAAKGPA